MVPKFFIMTKERLPYRRNARGQSCQVCVIARTRCKWNSGDKCDRCTRLEKDCHSQNPTTKYSKPNMIKKSSRLDRLEEKLDTLFAASRSGKVLNESPSVSLTTDSLFLNSPIPDSSNTPLSSTLPVDALDPSSQDPSILEAFRSLANDFPFVVLPENITIPEIMTSKPLLFKAMKLAAAKSPVQHYTLGQEIRAEVAKQIIIDGKKNLGILQALLVSLAYYHFHMALSLQTVNFCQLAHGQVMDLELNRSPKIRDRRRSPFPGFTLGKPQNRNAIRSTDEMRAYLGTFWISSAISMCVKKVNPLPYTTWTAECCYRLKEAREYESDEILLHLVELERIAQQFINVLPFDEPRMVENALPSILMTFEGFQTQLLKFYATVPPHIQQSRTFQLHYHAITIYLHEIGFELPLSHINCDSLTTHLPTRNSILHGCLQHIQTFFSKIFSIPFIRHWNVTFAACAHFVHALLILCKLSILDDDPTWNLEYVRSVIDFSTIIGAVITSMESVLLTGSRDAQTASERFNPFSSMIIQLKRLKSMYEAKVGMSMIVDTTRNIGVNSSNKMPTDPNQGESMSTSIPPSSASDGLFTLDDMLWGGLEDFMWQDDLWVT